MTTQKEMDVILITVLESIIRVCDLTTSGNVSHNISTIKCKCRDMLRFYKENPVSPWHSFIEGDIPPYNKTCLFNCDGVLYIGFVRGDDSLYLEHNLEIHLTINNIDYWMEVPKLPEE